MKIQSYSYPGAEDNYSTQLYLDRYDLENSKESVAGDFDGEDVYLEGFEAGASAQDPAALWRQAEDLRQNILNSSEADLSSRAELLETLESFFRIHQSGVDLPALWEGLATQLSDLESQFINDLLNSETEPPLKNTLEDLLAQVQNNSQLSEEQKTAFENRLLRLQNNLHIGDVDEEELSMELEVIRSELTQTLLHPPLASDLASRLGLDVEEVENLAAQHQVNLENLSTTPHDSIVRFLLAAQPELQDILSQVEQATTDKQNQDEEMVLRANLRNVTAMESNSDVDDMNFTPFEYLWQAQTGADEGSQAIQQKLERLAEKINESLSDLGDNFQYSPEEITELLGLDLPNSPELVPMAIDARGRGRYENFAPPEFFELIGQGYPYYSYQGTFNQ